MLLDASTEKKEGEKKREIEKGWFKSAEETTRAIRFLMGIVKIMYCNLLKKGQNKIQISSIFFSFLFESSSSSSSSGTISPAAALLSEANISDSAEPWIYDTLFGP